MLEAAIRPLVHCGNKGWMDVISKGRLWCLNDAQLVESV